MDNLMANLHPSNLPKDILVPVGEQIAEEVRNAARHISSSIAENNDANLPGLKTKEFTPSEVLVQLLYRGVRAHFEIARSDKPDQMTTLPTIEWARAILPGRIMEVIASRARRMQEGILLHQALYANGTFNYGFVIELTEHVPFRIDDATLCFVQLHLDLLNFLTRGGEVVGSWGWLACTNDGQITYKLTEPPASDFRRGLASLDEETAALRARKVS
jgi:hypothetical protein